MVLYPGTISSKGICSTTTWDARIIDTVTPSEIGGGLAEKQSFILNHSQHSIKERGKTSQNDNDARRGFRAATSGGSMTYKIGATKAGKITAEATIKLLQEHLLVHQLVQHVCAPSHHMILRMFTNGTMCCC